MLLTYQDLQPALNIDLTDPNGQELADRLIAATQAVLSGPSLLGFPIEQAEVTEYHDGGQYRYWLNTTAPVSALTAATRDTITNTYDTLNTAYVLNHGGWEVYVDLATYPAYHGLRLTYTTGWPAETLPDDVKQAIIDIVGIKLMDVAN